MLTLLLSAALSAGPGLADGHNAPAARAAKPASKALHAIPVVQPDGSSGSLLDAAATTPLAVVVIKHLGCPVCTAELGRLAAQWNAVRRAQGTVVALSHAPAPQNRAFMQAHSLPFPVLRARAPVFKALDFWLPQRGYPHPGVLFFDRCGQLAGRWRGRRPGEVQTPVILEALQRLAARPSHCQPSS